MQAEKFELFMGCMGNGTTVCNKAVMDHGDYKHIAHITNCGNIKLYVPADYIPEDEMRKIQVYAATCAKEFKQRFESLGIYRQYDAILNSVHSYELLEIINDKRPLPEKLPELRERYYKRA